MDPPPTRLGLPAASNSSIGWYLSYAIWFSARLRWSSWRAWSTKFWLRFGFRKVYWADWSRTNLSPSTLRTFRWPAARSSSLSWAHSKISAGTLPFRWAYLFLTNISAAMPRFYLPFWCYAADHCKCCSCWPSAKALACRSWTQYLIGTFEITHIFCEVSLVSIKD